MTKQEQAEIICEPFKADDIYTILVNHTIMLLEMVKNEKYMIEYLMDISRNYYNDSPMHMLGTINYHIQEQKLLQRMSHQ